MRFWFALAFGVALAACSPPASTDAPMPEMESPPAIVGPIVGEGVVTAIDRNAGTVTLDHGPIAAINWSAMTMRFNADAALLEGVAVGDRVSFELQSAESPRTLTALSKTDAP